MRINELKHHGPAAAPPRGGLRGSAVLVGLIPIGTAFGHWISKLIALPQLRRLAVGEIPSSGQALRFPEEGDRGHSRRA